MANKCTICKTTFTRSNDLKRHNNLHHQPKECSDCTLVLFGSRAHDRHRISVHKAPGRHNCEKCAKTTSITTRDDAPDQSLIRTKNPIVHIPLYVPMSLSHVRPLGVSTFQLRPWIRALTAQQSHGESHSAPK